MMKDLIPLFDPKPKVHLEVLTQSAVTTFRRCMREFQHAYIDLRRPKKKSHALRFGSFFHRGLNAWWNIETDPFAPKPVTPGIRLNAALIVMRHTNSEDLDAFDLVKAEELMIGYTAKWGDAGYKTIAVEQKFDVPIVNPETGRPSKTYRLQGSLDVVVEKDGRRYLVEHKTSSRDIAYASDYWRKISAMDAQVSTYLVAAEQMGWMFEACIYDVVRKVDLRPKLATPIESRRYTKKNLLDARQRENDETTEEFRLRVREDIQSNPDKYFARGEVVRLDNDRAEHSADLWMTSWMIRESERSNRFPRSPNACSRFGSYCSYIGVCEKSESIDNDAIFYTASEPHEELAREIQC